MQDGWCPHWKPGDLKSDGISQNDQLMMSPKVLSHIVFHLVWVRFVWWCFYVCSPRSFKLPRSSICPSNLLLVVEAANLSHTWWSLVRPGLHHVRWHRWWFGVGLWVVHGGPGLQFVETFCFWYDFIWFRESHVLNRTDLEDSGP